MAFKKLSESLTPSFNSAVSCEFLDRYESYLKSKISETKSVVRGKTFAPSSLRCNRQQWFKLRGTTPDVIDSPDLSLSFIANVGTLCHREIQENLKNSLGAGWVDVEDYMKSINVDREYSLERSKDSLETLVTFYNPPIRFACDGIVNISEKYYLLEIKTSEYSTWQTLTTAKQEHIDQVTAYSTLMKLPNVLMIYQERQYGELKCFEFVIKQSSWDDMMNRFNYVMDCVKKNLAPEGLPVGDKWCTPSYCPYYKKCQEYGRY
jgi:hypothetical protein